MSNPSNGGISQQVREYILLDKQIKQLNEQMRQLKKRQDPLEEIIKRYIRANKLENKDIKMQETKLRYEVKSINENLTQTYIQKTLVMYFKELYGAKYGNELIETKAKEVYDYLLGHREMRQNEQLKVLVA